MHGGIIRCSSSARVSVPSSPGGRTSRCSGPSSGCRFRRFGAAWRSSASPASARSSTSRLKVYRAGMFVRLAFASAIHVDPDILLVDEALAVGDAVFQHQCLLRIRQMQAQGPPCCTSATTWGRSSPSARGRLLDAGRILAEGGPADMASLYFARASAAIARAQAPEGPVPTMAPDVELTRFRPDADLNGRAQIFGMEPVSQRFVASSCATPAAVRPPPWHSMRKRCSRKSSTLAGAARASSGSASAMDGNRRHRHNTSKKGPRFLPAQRARPTSWSPGACSARSQDIQHQQRDRSRPVYRAYSTGWTTR